MITSDEIARSMASIPVGHSALKPRSGTPGGIPVRKHSLDDQSCAESIADVKQENQIDSEAC